MKIVSTVIAILAGLIVLLGYFFHAPNLDMIRESLLDWAITLAGIAALVAILNLVFGIHWKRVRDDKNKAGFSILLILAFLVTFGFGVILGPATPGYQKVVTAIQVPVESSLMAVLSISLAFASLKILQRQRNLIGLIFFISVVLFLVINSGVLSAMTNIPMLQDILSAFHQVPGAGARGILLGVALGSLLTGLRVLIGSDRPYNG
jgi:hypothetical protein